MLSLFLSQIFIFFLGFSFIVLSFFLCSRSFSLRFVFLSSPDLSFSLFYYSSTLGIFHLLPLPVSFLVLSYLPTLCCCIPFFPHLFNSLRFKKNLSLLFTPTLILSIFLPPPLQYFSLFLTLLLFFFIVYFTSSLRCTNLTFVNIKLFTTNTCKCVLSIKHTNIYIKKFMNILIKT